ncbi:MAG: hypothetical protein IIY58_06015 [Aeriscardovia sp.]|nr:hypothetical protein [Aeriscardovia sp.]
MKTRMNQKIFSVKNVALLLSLGLMAAAPVQAFEPEELELEEVVFTSDLDDSAVESKKNTEKEDDTQFTSGEEDADYGFVSSVEKKSTYDGPVLNPASGTVMGPSGKETYYNLDMSGVISIMRSMGNNDEYWVREDGVKMLGDYIMCAANLDVHPRGTLVESSLGTCIVCDTGGFVYENPYQLDIAVTW